MPTEAAMPTAIAPTMSDARAPNTMRLRISRPRSSVPSQ